MNDLLNKIVEFVLVRGQLLLGRTDGPMCFRFILQPVVAAFLAFGAGRRDAIKGMKPYFWSLFSEPGQRWRKLKDGWKSISKVFLFAFVLDIVYQFIMFPRLYPLQAFFVAIALAIIPYLIVRGLVTRILTRSRE